MKRRIFILATVVGVLAVLLACLILAAARHHQRNLDLARAARNGDKAQVHMLLANGADPNSLMKPPQMSLGDMLRIALHLSKPLQRGSTVLLYSARRDNTEILKDLLNAGGSVRDTLHEQTALVLAVQSHRHDNVELLIKYGSDVNCTGQLFTPLGQAASSDSDITDVQLLLSHGADPNGHDLFRRTPLMMATVMGSTDTIRVLLQAGADVNAQSDDGQTALMYAILEGRPDTVKILLQAKADVLLHDKSGKTAGDFAIDKGNKLILHLLNIKARRSASP